MSKVFNNYKLLEVDQTELNKCEIKICMVKVEYSLINYHIIKHTNSMIEIIIIIKNLE